ncbi:MAG: prolyl oligopeptidase family serine peptidase, partial [Fimbriiglobus sp.]
RNPGNPQHPSPQTPYPKPHTRNPIPETPYPKPEMMRTLLLVSFLMLSTEAFGQSVYQRPPDVVSKVLDAPAPPGVSLSPTRDTVLFVQSARYPAVAELAEPMLRLAGLRLNPKTHGPAREPRIVGLELLSLKRRDLLIVKLPEGRVTGANWAPDGKHFALTVNTAQGIELHIVDLSGVSRKIDVLLNGTMGTEVQWLDGDTLLVQKRLDKPAPVAPLAPSGPVVQESSGKAAPVRTFQDLLTSAHDEALFEHYGTSQLVRISLKDKSESNLGPAGMYTSCEASPDGKYFLVSQLHKPFSYLYPYSAFPRKVMLWDATGREVAVVHDSPLQDRVPIEGVPVGPRSIRWTPTDPATLVWAEALDGGDPKKKAPHRDQLFTWAAPFQATKQAVYKVEHRFRGIGFFENGDALVTDYDRERRWNRSVRVNFAKPTEAVVIFDRSVQDRYNDPGTPLSKLLPNNERVIRMLGDKMVVSSEGAGPKGDMPFMGLYDPATKKTEKLFTCKEGMYESVSSVISDDLKQLIIRRESPTQPANYFLSVDGKETALTRNVDPFPELRQVKKQLVTTKRPDGVTISFTLYTPANVPAGEKLPTVFWAYPREFNDASTAGQVSGSQNRFVTLTGYSHLFFLTQGYAVMDEVSMPIVGPPETANDTFLEQLVTTAKAAIDKAAEIGPIDINRIGVGGHSYGAFMTANLLAHSDLFRAGIARSGAYNRTLTPFGFQNERRTFWEAPEIYAKMSPFNSAHKIQEPILMIHGQADSNPGTFPVQSERLYQAIRGNGGTARLVLLPHEDHGYAGKESIEHVLAEQIAWFDKYVKGAKAK